MDEYEFDRAAELTELQRKMDTLRPDRYKSGDLTWAQEVIESLADHAEDDPELQRRTNLAYAEQVVKSWDRKATNSVNGLLREIKRTGALPLEWMDFRRLPLSIDKEKFRLGTVSPELLEQWELAERRRAASDFAARNDACDGARMLGDWITLSGSTFDDIDPTVCHAFDDDDDGEAEAS